MIVCIGHYASGKAREAVDTHKVVVRDGEFVYITSLSRVVELRIDDREPLGFEVSMIYKKNKL